MTLCRLCGRTNLSSTAKFGLSSLIYSRQRWLGSCLRFISNSMAEVSNWQLAKNFLQQNHGHIFVLESISIVVSRQHLQKYFPHFDPVFEMLSLSRESGAIPHCLHHYGGREFEPIWFRTRTLASGEMVLMFKI